MVLEGKEEGSSNKVIGPIREKWRAGGCEAEGSRHSEVIMCLEAG